MKIAILTRYENYGASSRVRFYQYLDYFSYSSLNFFVFPFIDNQYIYSIQNRKRSAFKILLSIFKRLNILLKLKNYDLIWVEKEFIPFAPKIIEDLVSLLFRNKYIVDYDDAVFHNFDNHPSKLIKFLYKNKYNLTMVNSFQVIVGNKYLKNKCDQLNVKNCSIIPSVINDFYYFSKPINTNKNFNNFTIGWIGSAATTHYLEIVKEALNSICENYSNIKIILIGSSNFKFKHNITREKWSLENEINIINNFDIGIMPLNSDNFSLGKCGFKIIQYMSLGVPVIASNVGFNKEIIDNGINGFLVNNTEEWIKYFKLLINDRALRIKLGSQARKKAYEYFSINTNKKKIFSILSLYSKQKYNKNLEQITNQKNNKVSVIMPFYNNEKTIREALLSIMNQSYKNIEIILIDDGSEDGSFNNIKDLLIDKNIKLIRDKTNKGLIYRLNQMIELTDAEFIARMDADDICHPKRIEIQINTLLNNDYDIVSTSAGIIDIHSKIKGIRDFDGQPTKVDFLKYGGLIHASILLKSKILKENKYNKEFYRAEDREFFLKIINKYKIYRINLPLYFVREFNFLNFRNMMTGYFSEYKAISLHGNKIVSSKILLFYFKSRVLLKMFFLYLFNIFGLLQNLSYKKMGIYNDNFYHLDELINKNKKTKKEIKRFIV